MTKKKKEKSASPKLGANYQNMKLAAEVIGPLAYGQIRGGGTPQQNIAYDLRKSGYHKSLVVGAADYYASRKLGVAAALTRKSLTAWAPEVFTGLSAADESALDPEVTYRALNDRFTGFDPSQSTLWSSARVKPYLVTKYGGIAARKILNATRLSKPINGFLNRFGVTL